MRSVFFLFLTISISSLFTPKALAQEQAGAFVRQPSVTLPAELDRVLRDYETAWENNDEDILASLFTEDGYVPSESGWLHGRDMIRSKYRHTGGDLRLRAIDFAMSGDVGFIIGAYGYGEAAAEIDRGNFVLALKKSVPGKWLIVADLDKTNR